VAGALLTQQDGPVLLLTIDRPRVRNALDPDTLIALADAIDTADEDGVRAIVLTGAGDNCFCSGMDLKALRALGSAVAPAIHRFHAALEAATRPPVVAAVRGRAVGGGFEIMMRCDLVVASTRAHFALPEVGRGLVPQGGALQELPGRLPLPLALELTLLGAKLDARRAAQLGLVNRVVPDAYVVATAQQLAAQLAEQPPATLRRARHLMRVTATEGPAAGRAAAAEVADPAQQSEAAAGLAQFTARPGEPAGEQASPG
jgi:enoyl-CoA hydratase